MKKLFALVLCLILVLGLVACSSKTEEKKPAESSAPTTSKPAIGVEIGSEPAKDNTDVSSEEASSEEETFDPNGDYDTGKDPFIEDDTVSEYVYENGFESSADYIIEEGLEAFTSEADKIHGGNTALYSRGISQGQPSFYVSTPTLSVGAECELTLFVYVEAATDGNIEICTASTGAANANIDISTLAVGEWGSITATFFADSADIFVKAPTGAVLYFDDLTLVYKQ